MKPVLSIKNLRVSYKTANQLYYFLHGISLDLYPGKTLALVGESGSGKSITASSIVNLFRTDAVKIAGGQIWLHDQDISKLSQESMQEIRGKKIGYISQNPLNSLNPTLKIGTQLVETISPNICNNKTDAEEYALQMLQAVGFSDTRQRFHAYPHELSGGMRQRVLIAMALINRPDVLIADEPTTALDVTIQAQVLDLLKEMQEKHNLSLLFITHDMGVVARIADSVAVMYAGRIVEEASAVELFSFPQHPYTQALLSSLPRVDELGTLKPIPGAPPLIGQYSNMCPYLPRCPFAMKICTEKEPPLVKFACWKNREIA